MLDERPRIEQVLQAVCHREGLGMRRMPDEHSGGTWRLRYTSLAGRPANLEVDLNFLLRLPLWPIAPMVSRAVCSHQALRIHALNRNELAGGRLCSSQVSVSRRAASKRRRSPVPWLRPPGGRIAAVRRAGGESGGRSQGEHEPLGRCSWQAEAGHTRSVHRAFHVGC